MIDGQARGAQARRRDWLVGQLPMGMLTDRFFTNFVSLFQELGTTLVDAADNVDNAIDVTVAPPEVVRWLGSWIGAPAIDESQPEARQRALVQATSRALAWRGTKAGLETYFSAVTEGPVEVVDSGGVFRAGTRPVAPPAVQVRVASTGDLADRELVALIADELPASAAFSIWVGDRPVWPVPAALGPGGSAGPASPAEGEEG